MKTLQEKLTDALASIDDLHAEISVQLDGPADLDSLPGAVASRTVQPDGAVLEIRRWRPNGWRKPGVVLMHSRKPSPEVRAALGLDADEILPLGKSPGGVEVAS